MKYVLTENGKENVRSYIRELEAKRKEILDAGKDTADETSLPTEEDILSDVELTGISWDDPDGPCYYNGWGVTDNYEADAPICLKLGRDLIIEDDTHESDGNPKYATVFLYKQYRDDYSCDKELIMVFPDRQSAENQLRSDVEDHFLTKWDDIPEAYAFDSDDVFQSDCVKYYVEGKATTIHWIIEEHSIEGDRGGVEPLATA